MNLIQGAAVVPPIKAKAGLKTPKHAFFVDSLAKNPSGRLLRRVLRDRFGLELTSH
jgi:fatty-acyl-CoA synthase